MVAVFWDDLFTNAIAQDAKLLYYNDITNNKFIIEWYKVPHVIDIEERETFQIILLIPAYYPTTTGDGEIIFQDHGDVEEPASITVGIENSNEDVGLLYLHNELYDVTANELQNEFAIRLSTKIPIVTEVKNESEQENDLPQSYSLEQNYPNPFNPETQNSIHFESGIRSYKNFQNRWRISKNIGKHRAAGSYEIIWNGTNDCGHKVSSGIYFYRIQSNQFSLVKKMILLK